MLSLHMLQLCLQVLVLGHLSRVLLIDAVEICHDFCVLVLHLSDFAPPFSIIFVFLLLQKLCLVLNPLFFKLEHLYLIIDVSAFDVTQLDLRLYLMHLVIFHTRGHRFDIVVGVSAAVVLTFCHGCFLVFVRRIAFDIMIICQLLSRWSVPFPFLFNRFVVSASVSPSERLLLIDKVF